MDLRNLREFDFRGHLLIRAGAALIAGPEWPITTAGADSRGQAGVRL
jgi:hypothetical protein